MHHLFTDFNLIHPQSNESLKTNNELNFLILLLFYVQLKATTILLQDKHQF